MVASAASGVLALTVDDISDIDTDRACMPCGQGAGSINDIRTCAEIVTAVVDQARQTIERMGQLV